MKPRNSPRHFVRLFKPRFAALVESGAKMQTIRPRPVRVPRAGDAITLRAWTGKPYRSKQRDLAQGWIMRVASVVITGAEIWINDQLLIGAEREEFARADGFASARELMEWFRDEHGLPFTGILIVWRPLP